MARVEQHRAAAMVYAVDGCGHIRPPTSPCEKYWFVGSCLNVLTDLRGMRHLMNRLKLMTIVGTRPEVIRLSSVIKRCDKYFDHVLVHTGQNWDDSLSRVFFDDFELREPDYYLEVAGANVGETMGAIISRSYEVLERERPDALLVLGDTNSALSSIPAKRLRFRSSTWRPAIAAGTGMFLR